MGRSAPTQTQVSYSRDTLICWHDKKILWSTSKPHATPPSSPDSWTSNALCLPSRHVYLPSRSFLLWSLECTCNSKKSNLMTLTIYWSSNYCTVYEIMFLISNRWNKCTFVCWNTQQDLVWMHMYSSQSTCVEVN